VLEDFIKRSIERVKLASEMSLSHYGKPLVCEYSGGKDSDALLWIFEKSNVPFEVHNSYTTVDAPPTVKHIRDTFRRLELKGVKCTIDYHIKSNGKMVTMWNLIPKKLMPPTRQVRYCCSELKEGGNANRMIATGVRWEESTKRSNRSPFEVLGATADKSIGVSDEKMLITDNDRTRRLFESCQLKAKTVVNPIIDWSMNNIWDIIHGENIPVCEMYSWGYERLGCIACPLARKCQREREIYDFPQYKTDYIKAFGRMLEVRKQRGKETKWTCGEEVYLWWMQDKNVVGQISLSDFMEI
jgi:3'-phosphoadenosine 5'-phosphosulfate sulfotransferase (PAPS reductase)/FAD synthetase